MSVKGGMSELNEQGEFEEQDLSQLLERLKFSHWRSALDELMGRYRGWLQHFWLDPDLGMDVWPMNDIIKTLVNFPPEQAGDDLALAKALAGCDFLTRVSRDDGQTWNALSQSYRDWLREHAKSTPGWSLDAPWRTETLVAWLLSQLPDDPGRSAGKAH